MNAIYRTVVLAVACAMLLPLSASAGIRDGSFEVGLFGGYNFFEEKQNLTDDPIIGGRFGYNITKNFGVEGVIAYIKSSVDDPTIMGAKKGQYRSPIDEVELTFLHVNAIYHFMPEGNFTPFITAGFGGARYSPKISDKEMSTVSVGVGAKYWLYENIAFRFDLNDYLVSEMFDYSYHNFGATLGITFAFGGRAAR